MSPNQEGRLSESRPTRDGLWPTVAPPIRGLPRHFPLPGGRKTVTFSRKGCTGFQKGPIRNLDQGDLVKSQPQDGYLVSGWGPSKARMNERTSPSWKAPRELGSNARRTKASETPRRSKANPKKALALRGAHQSKVNERTPQAVVLPSSRLLPSWKPDDEGGPPEQG